MLDIPELTAEEIQARVLHRDGLMLVIDKPAGLPVHRGPKGGANLESSFDALRFGLPRPPVLAHRLDKETSGVMIVAKNSRANEELAAQFRDRSVRKRYVALVVGAPAEREGIIDMRIVRDPRNRQRFTCTAAGGRAAVTRYKVQRIYVAGSAR